MTTTEGQGQSIDVLVLRCTLCEFDSTLMPKACRLTLYTHGLMILRFFCLHCHELVTVPLKSVDFAQAMSDAGVPTDVVRVPDEVLEHPSPDKLPINVQECRYLENVPLSYFQAQTIRELKLRSS